MVRKKELQALKDYLERWIKDHKDSPLHLIDISLHLRTIEDFKIKSRMGSLVKPKKKTMRCTTKLNYADIKEFDHPQSD